MALSRRIARPLLASIFVVGGLDALRNPAGKAPMADPVTGPLSQQLGMDPEVLIQMNGAVQVGAGVLLATGRFRRLASVALIGSIIPTTYAGHRFWEETEPATRAQQKMHFLKNLGLLGGLILAAFDTEGEPSLSWRARRRAHQIESAVAIGRAAGGSRLRGTARRSRRRSTTALSQATRAAGAGKAGAAALAKRVDLEPAQHLAAAGATAAKHLPSAVNDGLRGAGGTALKAVQDSGGTAADTMHQAASAVGAAVGQLEPLAEMVARSGLGTASPYLSRAVDSAGAALSKLPDPLAR